MKHLILTLAILAGLAAAADAAPRPYAQSARPTPARRKSRRNTGAATPPAPVRQHPHLHHQLLLSGAMTKPRTIAPGIAVRSGPRTKRRPIVQVLNAYGKTKLEEKIAAELRRQVLAKLDKGKVT